MPVVTCNRSETMLSGAKGSVPAIFEFRNASGPVFIGALCVSLTAENIVLAQLQNTFSQKPFAISFGDAPSKITATFYFISSDCQVLGQQKNDRTTFIVTDVYKQYRFSPQAMFRKDAVFTLLIDKFIIQCVLIASTFTVSSKSQEAAATFGTLVFNGFPL